MCGALCDVHVDVRGDNRHLRLLSWPSRLDNGGNMNIFHKKLCLLWQYLAYLLPIVGHNLYITIYPFTIVHWHIRESLLMLPIVLCFTPNCKIVPVQHAQFILLHRLSALQFDPLVKKFTGMSSRGTFLIHIFSNIPSKQQSGTRHKCSSGHGAIGLD